VLNNQQYSDRVEAGRVVEKRILDTIRKAGIQVDDPTPEEDMYDKIDGWIHWKGRRSSLQVKFREGGDDVIFEVVKDMDRSVVGRDMQSKAEFYAVMNLQHRIRLFATAPIKEMAETIRKHVLTEIIRFPNKDNWGSAARCNAKITTDKAHGNRKLMAYFNPGMLTMLAEWDLL
jgi:hypothetical protein